jgi:hypothetical protein
MGEWAYAAAGRRISRLRHCRTVFMGGKKAASALVVAALLASLLPHATALENGLARSPP